MAAGIDGRCGTKAMLSNLFLAISRSLNLIEPEYGCMPSIVRSSVVLPAPLGPTKQLQVPSGISKLIDCKTSDLSNRTERFSILIIGYLDCELVERIRRMAHQRMR